MTPSDLRERVARAIASTAGDTPDDEIWGQLADAAIAIVLEEAAKAIDALYPEDSVEACITPRHYDRAVNGVRDAAAAIRALKEMP